MADLLKKLLQAHSTPGDEGEVAAILKDYWRSCGMTVTVHGRYAVSACLPGLENDSRPVLLVCAHMDSPGFTVDAIMPGKVRLVPLGGAHFEAETSPGWLKTASGMIDIDIVQEEEDGERPRYHALVDTQAVSHGDRVCHASQPEIDETGKIISPFLDNRVGCWVLCQLAEKLGQLQSSYRIVLGATACEEMGGFGAPVLAREIQPDAVLCLDATYEDEEQGVLLGQGPVLTLSDASVILSPAIRDRLKSLFAETGLPLQTEVYNYSGTDSRAFPHAGLAAPVLALLVPTRGNHTPKEEGDMQDARNMVKAVELLAEEGF